MNIQIFKILGGLPTTNLGTAGQPFTDLLSPYQGSSKRLTNRVQVHCQRASKDFE